MLLKKYPIRIGQFIAAAIVVSMALVVGVSGFFSSRMAYEINETNRKHFQNVIVEAIVNTISIPIRQGSFLEAKSRLRYFIQSEAIACANLVIEGELIESCDGLDRQKLQKTYVGLNKISTGTGGPKVDLNIFTKPQQFDRVSVYETGTFFLFWFLISFLLISLMWICLRLVQKQVLLLIEDPGLEDIESANSNSFFLELKTIHKRLSDSRLRLREISKKEASYEIARKMAHDMRSPLSAFSIGAGLVADTGLQSVIRGAVSRIEKMLNELVKTYEPEPISGSGTAEASKESFDLLGAIQQVLAEKKLEFIDEQILWEIQLPLGELVVIGNEPAFMRHLSNIINNSIESYDKGDNKVVNISVESSRECARVIIEDQGSGMPAEVLKQIGERPTSFGKKRSGDFKGLGLIRVGRDLESWGGAFLICGGSPRGTKVVLELRSKPIDSGIFLKESAPIPS